MAASNLKKQATKKNEGSLAYVKGGLSTFFEAQDALAGERNSNIHFFSLFLLFLHMLWNNLKTSKTIALGLCFKRVRACDFFFIGKCASVRVLFFSFFSSPPPPHAL